MSPWWSARTACHSAAGAAPMEPAACPARATTTASSGPDPPTAAARSTLVTPMKSRAGGTV